MEFTADPARYSMPLNPHVRSAADLALASRQVEKTIMGLKAGEITTAVALSDLQKTQMLLLKEGRVQEAQEVTMALRAIQTGDTGAAEKTLMGTMVNLDQGKH
jgi:Ca-activated chloride channel family protein